MGELWTGSVEDVDGDLIRVPLYSQPVITTSPSEDHTYSAGNENSEESAADKANGSVGSINGVQGQERA